MKHSRVVILRVNYPFPFSLVKQKADIIKYRLSLDGHNKPVNSMFIGTLPEFELAVYTICFEVGDNNCRISLGGNPITIRTFPFYYGGKRMVASAYPVI